MAVVHFGFGPTWNSHKYINLVRFKQFCPNRSGSKSYLQQDMHCHYKNKYKLSVKTETQFVTLYYNCIFVFFSQVSIYEGDKRDCRKFCTTGIDGAMTIWDFKVTFLLCWWFKNNYFLLASFGTDSFLCLCPQSLEASIQGLRIMWRLYMNEETLQAHFPSCSPPPPISAPPLVWRSQ